MCAQSHRYAFLVNLLRGVVAILALIAFAKPSEASAAPRLPQHASPAGMTSSDVAGGGRILSGVQTSARSVGGMPAALKGLRGYFDSAPSLQSAVRSKDGRVTIALFDAHLRHTAVRGLIVTTAQPDTSEVACMFDDPAHLRASLPRMEADLATLQQRAMHRTAAPATAAVSSPSTLRGRWIEAAGRSRRIALTRTDFPDQTGSIGIAPGFVPSNMGTAGVIARAADGAAIRVQGVIGALDPRGNAIFRGGGMAIAEYSPDVATAWVNARRAWLAANGAPDEHLHVESSTPMADQNGKHSAIVDGYATNPSGVRLAYDAIVAVSPPLGSTASWTLIFTVLWAPVDRFASDAPSLFAMEASYSADMNRANAIQNAQVGAILRRSAAQSQAMLDSNAAARERLERNSALALRQSAIAQDYIQREGARAIHIIKGEDQVYDGTSARSHTTVSLGASTNFVPVPISEYIKGVDY